MRNDLICNPNTNDLQIACHVALLVALLLPSQSDTLLSLISSPIPSQALLSALVSFDRSRVDSLAQIGDALALDRSPVLSVFQTRMSFPPLLISPPPSPIFHHQCEWIVAFLFHFADCPTLLECSAAASLARSSVPSSVSWTGAMASCVVPQMRRSCDLHEMSR
jgi:hypothetical protein